MLLGCEVKISKFVGFRSKCSADGCRHVLFTACSVFIVCQSCVEMLGRCEGILANQGHVTVRLSSSNSLRQPPEPN
jgi:hypothetical protein